MTGVRKRSRVARLKKSVKAISPTIAVLLMIAIAVVASLVVYLWMMGFLNFNTAKAGKAIQIQSVMYTGTHLVVYVQNVGQSAVTFTSSQCLYIDGLLQNKASVNPTKLEQTKTTSVVDNVTLNLNQKVKLKVVANEGTWIEASFTVYTFTGDYTLTLTYVGNGHVDMVPSGQAYYYETVQLTAVADPHWIFGDPLWSGGLSGNTNPQQILMDGNKAVTVRFVPITHQVTFAQTGVGSDFTGNVVMIDGAGYTLPQTFTWNESDSHSFGFVSPLTVGTDKQYVWNSTTGDSTLQSANFVVPDHDATITGNYGTQYYLTVSSAYGTPGGAGWYDAGATAYATLNTGTVDQGNQTQRVFTNWSGDASGTGYANSDPMTMSGPKTAVANWNTQYQVTFNVDPPSKGTTTPSGWYDAGDVTIYATATDPSYKFKSWNATGTTIFADSSSNATTATINGPDTITATFILNTPTQYKLVYTAGTSQSLTVGHEHVSSMITVQRQDSNGNPVTTGGTITVALATNSTGGRFYSDPEGNNRIYSVPISSGSSSANFYYADSTTGSPVLTASSAGLTSATTQFTINNYYLDFHTGSGQTLATGQVSSSISVRRYQSDGSSYYGSTTITVALTTNSSNGHFCSNSNGSGTITSVAITSGNRDSGTFYYVDSAVGTPVLTASSAGYTSGQTTFTISSYYLGFRAGGGQTLLAGQVSSGITVRRYNPDGSSYYGTAAITVALTTSSSGGHFSANSDGSGTITSVAITSGNRDSGTFYYVDSAVGAPVLTASSAGYTSGQTTFTIRMPVLVFSAGVPQALAAGSISARITVQRQDGSGNAYSPNTVITVNLASSSGTGVFYSDAAGTQVITQITIASGADHAYIYYKDTIVGSPTLTASSTGYAPATTTFTVYVAGAKLVFTVGTSQTLTRNAVSSVITVQLQDSSGNPILATSAVTISLSSSSSGGGFYSDANGHNSITSVTIASGASSANFYYADSSAGTPTLTASSGSLTPATTVFTINSYQLAFSAGAPQTLTAGAVSARITVQRQDRYGNAYAPNTAIIVNLASSSVTGVFYSDAAGTQVITQITIASGADHAYIYYKDTTVGSPTLTISTTTAGYTSATTTFTIRMPVLVFSAGVPQALAAGSISSQITVQRQDGSGNAYSPNTAITVNLVSNSGGGAFYSNSGGTIQITSVTIASGASSANFYYKDTVVGSPTLTASSTGYAPATTTFMILASGAKLVFTAGAGQTLTASTVSSVITVQLQDSSGTPISAGAGGVVVSLSTNSSGRFYLDSAGNTRVTSVTIAGGASSANFYYYDSSSGHPILTASSGSLTPATTQFTINNYYLGFRTGGGQTLVAGVVSSSITVRRYNPDGSSYSGSAITVALTTNSSGGHFSANSDGSGTITSIAIASGSSTSSMFYYVDSAVGAPVLTASSAGYTSGQTMFTITGPASKLVFTAGASQSLYTNSVSSVIKVQRQDAAGYGVTSGGSITVSLAKTSTTGSFYANSDGTGGAITQITIASGSSSANFYYEDTAAGSSTITASSGSLTPATTTFTITVNQVSNGGFESSGSTWVSSGSGYASGHDDDDPLSPHSGSYYAEIDTTLQGTGTASGILTETFSSPIAISSIPNTAGSLSIWIYNNGYSPQGSVSIGYYSFQISVTANDGTQLIYWWGNTPATAPTETANTKVINMGTIQGTLTVGQWVDFSRNLSADWASKGLSPSTSLTSITIRGDGYYSGGNQYGQEIFIDDVQIQ